MIIGIAIPILVKNLGTRRAAIQMSGDFVVAKGFSIASPTESMSGDRVIPSGHYVLDAGKSQQFVLYKGLKVREWFANGRSTNSIRFHCPISATAGIDSVTQNWSASVKTTIYEPAQGNDSGARVVATPAPSPKLREHHRTYPKRAISMSYKVRASKDDD